MVLRCVQHYPILYFPKHDLFGDFCSINNIRPRGISVNDATFENGLEFYSKFYGTCAIAPENENITGTQKELLILQWKVGVIMYQIQ